MEATNKSCRGGQGQEILFYQRSDYPILDISEWESLYMLNGRPVKLRRDAQHELDELDIPLEDVIQGMRNGSPCPNEWMRKKGHHEICFKQGGKVIRVVYIEQCQDKDDDWVLIKHIKMVT